MSHRASSIRIPPLSPPLPGNSNATSSRNLFWSFLLSNSLPHTIHFTLHSYLHICILPTRLLSSWRGRFSTPLSLPYTLNQLKFKKRIKKLFPPVWLMPLLALTISQSYYKDQIKFKMWKCFEKEKKVSTHRNCFVIIIASTTLGTCPHRMAKNGAGFPNPWYKGNTKAAHLFK